jgi:D-xylose 1-dehydrogenase (NADP+, D-xylono-1,5-lactone-forming)
VTVRWGFIGAGYVASRAMAPAVHQATGAVLEAVASRDPRRSASLEPSRVHPSYEALIDDDGIDAVYVSLRNGQHLEWVLRALEAGRHVLCEKPLALDARDATTMFDAARAADRVLVEAVWMRWHPRFRRLTSLVRSGAVGPVTSIESSFTFVGTDMEGNYRLDPTQGGGALLDVGGYQTHTWLAVLGHEAGQPLEVNIVQAAQHLGDTGVDLTTTATVHLDTAHTPTPVVATQTSSFVMPSQQHLVVRGEQATVSTGEGEAFTAWNVPTTLFVGEVEERFAPVDPFQSMVESVSARIDGVAGDDDDQVPEHHSVTSARIIDLIRATSTR